MHLDNFFISYGIIIQYLHNYIKLRIVKVHKDLFCDRYQANTRPVIRYRAEFILYPRFVINDPFVTHCHKKLLVIRYRLAFSS